MLATREIPNGSQYLATKVPGAEIIMVVRYKEYVQDYSNVGFQFERFVTGKAFDDTPQGILCRALANDEGCWL